MRIGLLIGPPALVHELNKVRLPYNLNSLSQAAAGFYLDEEEAFLRAGGGDTQVARRAFFGPGGAAGHPSLADRCKFYFF